MALESKTITLPTADGDEVFTVSQLPAMRGVKLFARLSQLVGPGVAALGKGLAKAKGLPDLEEIAPAIGALLSSLDPDPLEAFLMELFASTKCGTVDLGRPIFDAKFRGRMDSVWKLTVFALEVQFGNFFGDLAARAAALQAKPVAPSAPSITSSGPSTG